MKKRFSEKKVFKLPLEKVDANEAPKGFGDLSLIKKVF
jgi:hypothetical protein